VPALCGDMAWSLVRAEARGLGFRHGVCWTSAARHVCWLLLEMGVSHFTCGADEAHWDSVTYLLQNL
jgi:hypothetical protein